MECLFGYSSHHNLIDEFVLVDNAIYDFDVIKIHHCNKCEFVREIFQQKSESQEDLSPARQK